jgi:hypothetical protein
MSLFIRDKAYKFFNHHSLQVINKNINIQVNIYKLILSDSETNIYSETTTAGKAYYPPIKTHCLIQHDDQMFDYNAQKFGVDITQTATFFFQREYLKAIDLVTEIGDIIEWNETYWHIDEVIENKLIHSLPQYNYADVCKAHMTERSRLNLDEIRFGYDDNSDIEKIKNL